MDTIVLLPVGSTRVMFEEKKVTYNLLGKCLMLIDCAFRDYRLKQVVYESLQP